MLPAQASGSRNPVFGLEQWHNWGEHASLAPLCSPLSFYYYPDVFAGVGDV